MARFISDSKMAPDGALVEPAGAIVTALFPSYFYIESANRSFGMRVEKADYSVPFVGTKVDIQGEAHTNSNGERYIAAYSISRTGTGSIAPLALNNSWLGGGAFGLQGGVMHFMSAGSVKPAVGLNNIGMLVTTWGRIQPEQTTANSFVVDDGSGNQIKCIVPNSVTISPNWRSVAVTGICSCESLTINNHSELRAVIRVRIQDDISSY